MVEPKVSTILKAFRFAQTAHADQKRKYTNEPYIVHPTEVAQIVMTVPHDLEMVAAAYLHDVAEDTTFTILDIFREFGADIAQLVDELTDKSDAHMGNREHRKAFDRDNLAKASPRAQTIKYADLISNTKSIVAHDPKFAKVYLDEKRQLLDVMTRGDASLRAIALAMLTHSTKSLETI